MRKFITFAITITAACLIFMNAASAEAKNAGSTAAAEQTILRLLSDPVQDAIQNYYGEYRQCWRDEILCIRKVPDTPYYEVIMQVETFVGPHNPPYGIETMTFYVSYGEVELKKYEHKDEPD